LRTRRKKTVPVPVRYGKHSDKPPSIEENEGRENPLIAVHIGGGENVDSLDPARTTDNERVSQ